MPPLGPGTAPLMAIRLFSASTLATVRFCTVTVSAPRWPAIFRPFHTREGLEHADSCRFVATDKNGQLYLGTGVVKRGLLELSNTDLAQEFIKVIESQRAYSFCLKMVTTSDEIETTINGLR